MAPPNQPRRWSLLVVSLVLVVAAVAAWSSMRGPSTTAVRIATGQKGGTFLPLGQTLANGFAADIPGVEFTAIESAGGLASIEMLEAGEAELALLSNHVRGASSVQLVVPLYQETLQIVVRRAAKIATPHDLVGRRVSVGPQGSGTETIADTVLQHFGIGADRFDRRNVALADAVTALGAGELDAAFIVGGMRTPAVDQLLETPEMSLLSLGEPGKVGSALEGIRLDAPFFTVTSIPEHAYGLQPEQAIGTISVYALLVARADLDEDLVHDVTESLFSHKVELSTQERLLSHLSERYDPALSPYPLHPGADRYYRRDEPTVVQQYSDQIGLALTVGALLWSGLTALRAAQRQRHRSRIEVHYESARRLAAEARQAAGADDIAAARERLVEARQRALDELEREQLDANEAFVILQDHLTAAIAEIDRRAARS